MRRILCIFLLLTACQPTTKNDFISEGKSWMTSITSELQEVYTKEDIQRKLPILTKKFNKLANLILQVRKNGNVDWDLMENENMEAKHLIKELERIYCIPGAKEVIDLSQIEALQMLQRR